MDAIRPLWERMPLSPLRRTEMFSAPSGSANAASGTQNSFRDMVMDLLDANPVTDLLNSAVDAVRETDTDLRQMEYLMATGQLDNPAPLLIASTKAQTSVDLLVQLRNRALDAYNELMRISL